MTRQRVATRLLDLGVCLAAVGSGLTEWAGYTTNQWILVLWGNLCLILVLTCWALVAYVRPIFEGMARKTESDADLAEAHRQMLKQAILDGLKFDLTLETDDQEVP